MEQIKLSAKDIGRYIGQQVQVGENPKQRGELVSVGKIFVTVFYVHGKGANSVSQHYFRDVAIKPVLRKIESLTDKEYEALFEIIKRESFVEYSKGGTFFPTAKECLITAKYLDMMYLSDLDLVLYSIEAVDYLDGIGIDIRGYIDQGLAVEL